MSRLLLQLHLAFNPHSFKMGLRGNPTWLTWKLQKVLFLSHPDDKGINVQSSAFLRNLVLIKKTTATVFVWVTLNYTSFIYLYSSSFKKWNKNFIIMPRVHFTNPAVTSSQCSSLTIKDDIRKLFLQFVNFYILESMKRGLFEMYYGTYFNFCCFHV